jgi:hypothetical protein
VVVFLFAQNIKEGLHGPQLQECGLCNPKEGWILYGLPGGIFSDIIAEQLEEGTG